VGYRARTIDRLPSSAGGRTITPQTLFAAEDKLARLAWPEMVLSGRIPLTNDRFEDY
jgi:hypothetical protein